MSKPKLYLSDIWLKRKYLTEKLTPEQIAALCECSHMTIYRRLNELKILKKR